ncbi:MAG: hypothetical protein M0Q91_16985 [Methanoregula sp.]|jgi:hypothetical protein|nr:hypothetical protein [Methanoregula sp.]
MNDMRTTTTISLQKSTVRRMAEFGKFNESFDELVTRLLDTSEKNDGGD